MPTNAKESWVATVETTCKNDEEKEHQGYGDTEEKAYEQAEYKGAGYCASRGGVKKHVRISCTRVE